MAAGSQPRFDPVRQRRAKQAPPPVPLALPAADSLRLDDDPYLLWACSTAWRGYQTLRHRVPAGSEPSPEPPTLKLLVVLGSRDTTLKALLKTPLKTRLTTTLKALRKLTDVKVPPLYDELVAESATEHFFTTELPLAALAKVMAVCRKYHCQVELATPLRDQHPDWPGDGKARAGRQARWRDSETAAKPSFAGLGCHDPEKGSVTGGTIGIFDYGCPFLRTEFDRGRNGTRLRALWHQQEMEAIAPWAQPEQTGYGRVLAGGKAASKLPLPKILAAMRRKTQNRIEARAYASLQYLVDLGDPRRRVHRATHGAHVMHVAAGWPDPLQSLHSDPPPDAAAQANLIFVQMPEATAADSSGASLGAYLLDGLRYMMALTKPSDPLVVNVSYGGTAGPHDGSTLIERAMDQLLQSRPRMQIVIAAGNARHLGLHARRDAQTHAPALFRIDVAPGDRTDTFVEFWYSCPAGGLVPEFRTRLPDGDWSGWVGPDADVALADLSGDKMAALIHRKTVPIGKPSLALLAICPTEAPDDDDGPLAPAGLWEVEVRLQGEADAQACLPIKAWIKRDDSRPFSGRVQSRFVGLEPEDTQDSLNSLACGTHTIVAGGFRGSDGMAVDYGSTGPRHPGQWPLVYGLCERDSIDPGIRAAAVRSGETLVMNGTSVAAPVVARQVYKLLAAEAGLQGPALRQKLREEAQRRGSRLRMDEDP